MKLAVTVWNDRIAPVYDCAGTILLLDVRGKAIVSETKLRMSGQGIAERARTLRGHGVSQLICGALSWEAKGSLRGENIDIHSFIAGDVSMIISAWMKGALDDDSFSMPGCCRARRRRGMGGGRCRGISNGIPQ